MILGGATLPEVTNLREGDGITQSIYTYLRSSAFICGFLPYLSAPPR